MSHHLPRERIILGFCSIVTKNDADSLHVSHDMEGALRLPCFTLPKPD